MNKYDLLTGKHKSIVIPDTPELLKKRIIVLGNRRSGKTTNITNSIKDYIISGGTGQILVVTRFVDRHEEMRRSTETLIYFPKIRWTTFSNIEKHRGAEIRRIYCDDVEPYFLLPYGNFFKDKRIEYVKITCDKAAFCAFFSINKDIPDDINISDMKWSISHE